MWAAWAGGAHGATAAGAAARGQDRRETHREEGGKALDGGHVLWKLGEDLAVEGLCLVRDVAAVQRVRERHVHVQEHVILGRF